jgi:hypothetical protein
VRHRAFVCGLLIVAGLTAVAPMVVTVTAWEEDVHYVLTFWLATQAGFSRGDADQIAKADQSYDDSEHAAAIPTVLWIILRGDLGAARDLQVKHFPSDADLPSPPLRRVVAPNSPSARHALEGAMNAGALGTALTTLGEAFHPFQDSWSHQGVPDIPYNLKPNLISAHPAKRGGWSSHDADLTYLHVDDTVEVARETYRRLVQFLELNPRFRQRNSAAWPQLETVVRAFATSKGSVAKVEWATRYVPEARTEQLGNVAKPGGKLQIAPMSPPLFNQRPGQPRLSTEEQASLVNTTNEFLRLWLTQGNIPSAMSHIDLDAVANQFSASDQLTSHAAIGNWCAKFLTMQMIDDHQAVNEAGHGDPRNSRYSELPTAPTNSGPFKATRRADPPKVIARDFVTTDVLDQPSFALILGNADAIRDALTLVWRRTNGRWTIVRLFAVAD